MGKGRVGERFIETMMEALFGGKGPLEEKGRIVEVVGGCKRKTY